MTAEFIRNPSSIRGIRDQRATKKKKEEVFKPHRKWTFQTFPFLFRNTGLTHAENKQKQASILMQHRKLRFFKSTIKKKPCKYNSKENAIYCLYIWGFLKSWDISWISVFACIVVWYQSSGGAICQQLTYLEMSVQLSQKPSEWLFKGLWLYGIQTVPSGPACFLVLLWWKTVSLVIICLLKPCFFEHSVFPLLFPGKTCIHLSNRITTLFLHIPLLSFFCMLECSPTCPQFNPQMLSHKSSWHFGRNHPLSEDSLRKHWIQVFVFCITECKTEHFNMALCKER